MIYASRAVRSALLCLLVFAASACRDEAPRPALRPSAQGVETHEDAAERDTNSEATAQLVGTLQRTAAAAVAHGHAWAGHRLLRGCVTIDSERVRDGFVELASNSRHSSPRAALLESGCYTLRVPQDFGSSALVAVIREPASGRFLQEVAANAARADVALSIGDFVPVEIELVVHPGVTRERLALRIIGGRGPIDERFIGWAHTEAARELWDPTREVFPVPDRTVVLVQRGRFIAYVTSYYDELDRHRGIVQGGSHAVRIGNSPWQIDELLWMGPIELDTSAETRLTLFVCRVGGSECDELPPWSPPDSVECPPGTVVWERDVPEGTESTCRDAQRRAHGPALRTNAIGEFDTLGVYERGAKHGRWYTWTSNGKTLSVRSYTHGQAHGDHRYFFSEDPAQVSAIERYEHGERHGEWVTWHAKGGRASSRFFCNGKACGRWSQRSSEGAQLAESAFDAQGNGPFTEYFDSGSPRVSGQYVDGVQAGEWTWFDESSGEVVQRCLVEDGRSVECSLEPEERRLELPP